MAETITKLYGPKLQEHYADLLKYILLKIGYVPTIIEVEENRFHFKANKVVNFLKRDVSADMNTIWGYFEDGLFFEENMILFYTFIGYSLCGVEEIFEKSYTEDEE